MERTAAADICREATTNMQPVLSEFTTGATNGS